MTKKKSISDLSKELGISTTTISYVINGKGKEKRISEKVIERIEKYIDEVGYQPDFLGRSLRTGKSMTIGLVVGDLANPFFAEIASEIEKLATKHGYSVIVASSNNELKLAQRALKVLIDRKVDGIAIAISPGQEKEIRSLIKSNTSIVMYDRYFEGMNTCNVTVDNQQGAYEGVKHLYQNGFRNIALISFDLSLNNIILRNNGYLDFVKENALKPLVFHLQYEINFNKVADLIYEYLKLNPAIDALFVTTNILTLASIQVMKKLEKEGRKVALVSFDDHTLYEFFTPTITAIAQPIQQICKTIMEQLLLQINGEEITKGTTITIPTIMKVRQSSMALNK